MDFFQAQQDARRSTKRIVLMFVLAVTSLIVMTNILVMFVFGYFAADDTVNNIVEVPAFDWQLFIFIAVCVCVVVFAGSIYKTMSLGGGGKAVAEALGGRLVNQQAKDLDERKLLNVVEEMAIASGCPVPQVYILDQEFEINAFAAGFKNSDAVIGVTLGCIEQLDRDELQGVIAHEFSHVLNGDMRLNMRLLGILHGILVIGYIGYYILRTVRGNSKNTGPILALGAGLVAIGFGGNFFGNMIKSSVSRQREYLADASAVQFTRSKEGIANALNKISNVGSNLESPVAPQMSHAYFSTGVSSFVESMFATHPPIEKRIKAISPYYFIKEKIEKSKAKDEKQQQQSAKSRPIQEQHDAANIITSAVIAAQVLKNIGNVDDQQLATAKQIISEFPEDVFTAIHDITGARAFIYCLLLDDDEIVLNRQLRRIKEFGDKDMIDHVLALRESVNSLEVRHRLPLIDIAIPTLKQLSQGHFELFEVNMEQLIDADGKWDLFEWILQKLMVKHVASHYQKTHHKRQRQARLSQCQQELGVLFGFLLQHGNRSEEQITFLKPVLTKETGVANIEFPDGKSLKVEYLEVALNRLANIAINDKPKLIRACLCIITVDKIFSVKEMELLRAICDVIDCPVPPHLNGMQ
ncbi:M48 family metallopeptidase [Thalassotalea crassostreae]|uniref:M48 family metallopeptidase n=1 Tax=Thalassotalea crassostreae TaxID=1763536 RepID=UPI000838D14C|nr:M48 family metallopeptidase [Thalassotalea crassostreae]